MVTFVVGATLFMGHLAAPQLSQSTQANAGGGNFFKFEPAAPSVPKPHSIAAERTPAPRPSPLATRTAAATPAPTYEQLLADRKKKLALALREHPVKATPSTVALVNSAARSDVPGTPRGFAAHPKHFAVATEPPPDVQSQPAATPQTAPAATAAQIASAPTQSESVYSPGTIMDARFISRQVPNYPEIAREQDARGTAIVLVTIGPKGNVLGAHVSQSTGFQMLDNAALDAAHGSTFLPPLIDGKPATATYRITYDFSP